MLKKIILSLTLMISFSAFAKMETITLIQEDLLNQEKTINFLKKIAVLHKIDGEIKNNTIVYDQNKFNELNMEEELEYLEPRIEKLIEAPDFEYVKVGSFYLFVVDRTPKPKQKFHKRIKNIPIEEYPSEVEIVDFDPNISNEAQVYYLSYLAILHGMNKDLNKEKIKLSSKEIQYLFGIKEMYNEAFLNIEKAKVCEKENLIGDHLVQVPFRGKEYYITLKENCANNIVDKNEK